MIVDKKEDNHFAKPEEELILIRRISRMKTGVHGMVKDRKATAFRKRKSTMQSGTERLWPS